MALRPTFLGDRISKTYCALETASHSQHAVCTTDGTPWAFSDAGGQHDDGPPVPAGPHAGPYARPHAGAASEPAAEPAAGSHAWAAAGAAAGTTAGTIAGAAAGAAPGAATGPATGPAAGPATGPDEAPAGPDDGQLPLPAHAEAQAAGTRPQRSCGEWPRLEGDPITWDRGSEVS